MQSLGLHEDQTTSMGPPTPQEIEALVEQIADQILDSRSANRRSIGVSLVTSVFVAGVWWATANPRPDPWTATQAGDANERIEIKIRAISADLDDAEDALRSLAVRFEIISRQHENLENSVRRHHEESERWKARIQELERRMSQNHR